MKKCYKCDECGDKWCWDSKDKFGDEWVCSDCQKSYKDIGQRESELDAEEKAESVKQGNNRMKILVACEESQTVCIALRKLGHEAYSCDILECSGGHPEWHIKEDINEVLYPKWCTPKDDVCINFSTMDGKWHAFDGEWDMIIAFPPCTDLCVSGARHFAQKIADGRQQASIDFFMIFANHPCKKIAIENPVGIMSSKWRKPNQIINPWQFGDSFNKKTCLWLKGLPNLIPTNIVEKEEVITFDSGKRMSRLFVDSFKLPSDERSKLRSKTFQGIADAMANQWTQEDKFYETEN